MSEALNDNNKHLLNKWMMGLTGFPAMIANMTAIGLICLMFYQDRQESFRMAREDRAMYREELTVMRAESQRTQKSFDDVTLSIRSLVIELQKGKK